MKTKFVFVSKTIWVLIFMNFVFFGCMKKTEIVVVQDTGVNTKSNGASGPTDNVGGGNGVEGRPLESYSVSMTDFDLYKEKIKPLLIKVYEKSPDLAFDMFHIIYNRTWYFLPVELDVIPKINLGSFAKTDQMALQDLNKVWVNDIIFNKMNDNDKFVLIIHEIIMGIRLLKFKDANDLCKIKSYKWILIQFNNDEYKKQIKDCNFNYPYLVGEENLDFKLNKEDYDQIRKIVIELTNTDPDIDYVKELVEYYKFRKY